MNDTSPAPRGVKGSGISWLTIVLALLAVGTFLAISNPNQGYVTMMGIGRGALESSGGYAQAVPPTAVGGPMMDKSVSNTAVPSQGMMAPDSRYYPYPYPNPETPISDAREFLKVYYNASMYTRDVQGLTRRVETTVRGYDGRIDSESSSPQYGSVSFAVPQSKYDAFRTELEGLVDGRFLTVNISSQNLLPQKQSIEAQQTQATTALSDYRAARQKIVNAHVNTVQSLQGRIDADTRDLLALRAQAQTPQVQAQIQSLSDDLYSLNQQLANENTSYSAQLKNADANIKYAEDWQKAVQTQDKNLLDTVATVTGTVSIQWISLWETAQLYLPGYWIPAIFAALALLSYLRDRRRFGVV